MSVAGCPDAKQGVGRQCDIEAQCQVGLVCVEEQCQEAGTDTATGGGGPDGGASGASGEDTGTWAGTEPTGGMQDTETDTAATTPGETHGDDPQSVLLREDFAYPAGHLHATAEWAATGQPFVLVAQPSLTYPAYAPDDIGRHAFVPLTTEPPEGAIVGEELVRRFDGDRTLASSAVCYVAFLVNFGEYTSTKSVEILALWAGKEYRVPLVYARPTEIGYFLSLYPPGGDAMTTKTPLKANFTYLVVVKYALDGTADERSLFVYENFDVPLSEPWVPLVRLHNLPTDGVELPIPSSLAGVALWRGSDSHGVEVRLDAVRVTTSWSGLFL